MSADLSISPVGSLDVDALLPPLVRLEKSREQMRLAMHQGHRHSSVPLFQPGSVPHWAEGLLKFARSFPAGEAVVDVFTRWWANHPLRDAALVARETAAGVAGPIAQRNPFGLVIGAAVIGALMSRVRPWRWIPRSLLLAGLLPQITSRLVSSVPLDAWLNALTRKGLRTR